MVSYTFHDSSYIEPGAVIGENTQIGYFCHIMSGSKIGSKCTIGDSVTVMPDCVIGNNVTIQNGNRGLSSTIPDDALVI